jgi:hypothetical protein
MDVTLMAVLALAIVATNLLVWSAGRGSASRDYAHALATARVRERQLRNELDRLRKVNT